MRYGFAVGISVLLGGWTLVAVHAADDKLVYADFEKIEGNRPVSSRGGLVQLYAYEEDHVHKSTFKGQDGLDPPGPELVHVKAGDPNHAAKFDYSLLAPNQWSGVAMEIHGRPDADGGPQPDDVSGYKYLTLQVYATGIRILRLEIRSNESGKDTRSVFPLFTLEVKPGFNTYRVPLSGFGPAIPGRHPRGSEGRAEEADVDRLDRVL